MAMKGSLQPRLTEVLFRKCYCGEGVRQSESQKFILQGWEPLLPEDPSPKGQLRKGNCESTTTVTFVRRNTGLGMSERSPEMVHKMRVPTFEQVFT
jgi:hypothetical protein